MPYKEMNSMQDNTITLVVDEANDGSTTADVNHVYERFDTFSTRSVFNHTNHSPDLRDFLTFYRTPAKRSGNSRGKQRSSVKFTVDVAVPGVDGVDIIETSFVEVNLSFPLGVSDEFMKKQRQRAVSILDSEAVMVQLNKHLGI